MNLTLPDGATIVVSPTGADALRRLHVYENPPHPHVAHPAIHPATRSRLVGQGLITHDVRRDHCELTVLGNAAVAAMWMGETS